MFSEYYCITELTAAGTDLGWEVDVDESMTCNVRPTPCHRITDVGVRPDVVHLLRHTEACLCIACRGHDLGLLASLVQ